MHQVILAAVERLPVRVAHGEEVEHLGPRVRPDAYVVGRRSERIVSTIVAARGPSHPMVSLVGQRKRLTLLFRFLTAHNAFHSARRAGDQCALENASDERAAERLGRLHRSILARSPAAAMSGRSK